MEYHEEAVSKEQRISDFIEKIRKADGQLIPLNGQKTKLDEQILISARYGEVDLPKAEKLLLIDVFAKSQDRIKPIGHYDWEVSDLRAHGNTNRHWWYFHNTTQAHELAELKWVTSESFKVDGITFRRHAREIAGQQNMDLSITEGIISGPGEWDEPVYRGQGLGSLMIAASAIVLNSKGVRTANLGGLSPSASGVWRKFGVQGGTPVDVKTILQLPQTDQIIRRYV